MGLDAHNHFDFYPRIGNFERGTGQAHVAGWLQPSWQCSVSNELLALVADLWVPAAFHYWLSNVGVVYVASKRAHEIPIVFYYLFWGLRVGVMPNVF